MLRHRSLATSDMPSGAIQRQASCTIQSSLPMRCRPIAYEEVGGIVATTEPYVHPPNIPVPLFILVVAHMSLLAATADTNSIPQ